ncbi:MAG: hypothetical protein IJ386_03675 [Clostridia bacterium]|nr:hypothetical protein [Clostridia bacterium]
MICSEYIYTSWKGGGGFATFAKSEDITAEELQELTGKLTYSKPVELPDNPGDEEIRTLFPVNSVYFRLKSGRYCMAQSSYVGKDYAMDVNPRWGNFMIHAYLFDSPDGELAAMSLESDLYKHSLTDEERKYVSILVPEPVEIEGEEPEDFGEDALGEIFELGEDGEYFTFLQAVMDRVDGDAIVLVGISDSEKIARWIKAMPLVLPKRFTDSATYGTYLLYKDESYKINFIYNYSTFDAVGETARCPDNAVLFFDSGTVIGESPLCEYLSEYKSSYGNNPRAAYRLKYDVDGVLESDPSADLAKAVRIKHYLNRNVKYFDSLASFKELTLYILERKESYPRASETAMYMIKNSFFDDEERRSLFFIGDVFQRLEEGERESVRQDFFAECFINATDAADFVFRYESNPLVTGDYSPLCYGFFLRFIENRGEDAQKAIRFIVDLEETRYHEFDKSLKVGYLSVAKVYFIGMAKSGKTAAAEKCLRRICIRSGDTAAAEVIRQLLADKVSCFGDVSFDLTLLDIAGHDRDLYWQLFRAIIAGLQNEREIYRDFVNSYAELILRDGERDRDIGEYAKKYNFESFLGILEYRVFAMNPNKQAGDFANAFNTLFGKSRPYEGRAELQKEFYSALGAHLDGVKAARADTKERGVDGGLYDWLTEVNALVSMIVPDAASVSLLSWLTEQFERNLTVEELSELSDVGGRIIFIRGWRAFADNVREYAVLARYLDVLSMSGPGSREQYPPFYLKDFDGIFARLPEKYFLSSVNAIVRALFSDMSLTRRECDKYISPLMLCKDGRYKSKVYDAVADSFEYAVEKGNIEPLVWAVDYYVSRLPRRGDAGVAAEKIEDGLIFPMLERTRKQLAALIEENKKQYEKKCPQVLDYMDGISYNMLNKPKRVRPMKVKR